MVKHLIALNYLVGRVTMSSENTDLNQREKRGLSRRQMLGAGAVAVAGVTALQADAPHLGIPQASAQTAGSMVRPSANFLFSNGQQMQSLRRGVQVMKSRPFEDPTSWAYQAAIHGYGFAPPAGLPQDMVANMSNCIHGPEGFQRYFLPWHRLYLHYFERILRAASGDPGLTLPYWNYSQAGGAAIPLGFRWPADTGNALYNGNRNRFEGGGFQPSININRGDPLPPNYTDIRPAMSAFGYDRFSDVLEQGVHGNVHVGVGGRDQFGVGGDMSGFNTAALDPIFWLHHCNVDRLWSRWLDSSGNNNPASNAWRDRQFSFYDENGQRVQRFVADAADTRTLGYTYDDEPFNSFIGFESVVMASRGESGGIEEELAASENAISLTGRREKVAVTPTDSPAAESQGAGLFFTEQDAADSRPVILRLAGIDYEGAPGYLYEIYVNMPDGTGREEAAPYYAGTLAPFGLAGSPLPLDIDISGLLNRQIEKELFLGGQVTVEFIPAGVGEDEEAAEITVAAISLVRP